MATFTEFTVREVYEAIAKNGFAHIREEWTAQDFEGQIYGGCVLQQGGMNLGVAVNNETGENETSMTLATKLDEFLIDPKNPWYTSNVGHKGAGSIIIYWNDKAEFVENEDGEGEYIYDLPTYEAVTEMAYEVLEPFFDHVITLENREWNFKRKADANA